MPRTYGLLLATGVCLLALSGAPFVPSLVSVAAAQETAAADAEAAADDKPAPLSEDELEILVARIALYPDELVAVVTSASLYPLQIVEAARYLEQVKKDAKLKPKDTWDGSIVSLLNYPDIVKMMSEDLDWTQSLGEALSYQQKDVLVAIQQLRDKAVADGIIKTDDKIKVSQENDNVVIVSANPEKIYVPQYPPEMLYEPDYVPAPISYYPDSYPNYYYPTATFFAGAVTGAIWASVVDWDDWGVWGGRWNGGDADIDCNNCFNNINGKLNINDVDWKNVDRSKIKFDNNQFNKIDRNSFKNNIKADGRNNIKAKANVIGNDRTANIRNKPGNVSVKDVRNSKIDADRINRDKATARNTAGKKPGQVAQNRRQDAKINKPAGNVKQKVNAKRPVAKPKPAARIDNRPRKPSALGKVDSGRRTQMQSNRGRQAMGGGNRGGGARHHGGGGGRRGGGGGRR
ncbi:DUF3300 domain-containing protein [Rhizobium herbae]|jgi:hypothetical protein